MAWISIQQDLNDIVKFVHSENQDEIECLMYNDFISYVASNSSVINYQDFLRQLNTFFPIFLDLETGEWEIFQLEKEDLSYSDLIKINKENKEVNTLPTRLWEVKKQKIFGSKNDYRTRSRFF
jgi:hypothetical protein